MKHVAYVLKNEFTKVECDVFGNETREHIVFDEPKQKMIASGGEAYCLAAIAKYKEKHPDAECGVIESLVNGDPWYKFWSSL
ncbi:hypothetical protein SEA_GIBBLES_42 [Gordonia phage Gibbles]|nr:hypothetical protein SEA_GIBBLES_42 [Gordonia phage Gibbles]